MYQTRGLFYPSLSQRVYQSNQSLKLAAKAGCHPKGEFIRLKPSRLPNDSNIDMKHNRHCFFLAPSPPVFTFFSPHSERTSAPRDEVQLVWDLPCPPRAPRVPKTPVPGCSCQERAVAARSSAPDASWQALPVSTPSLSPPIQARSLRNMNNVKNYPLLLTGIR